MTPSFFSWNHNSVKNNQVNAWFKRKMRAKRDVTCCWFDQNPSNSELNSLEQHTASMVTFVIWWMRMGYFMAKRLLLPIMNAEFSFFTNEFPSIKQRCRAVSNAQHGKDWCPRWFQSWSYQCQGVVSKWFLSTFFSEIRKQYHFILFVHQVESVDDIACYKVHLKTSFWDSFPSSVFVN